MALSSIWKSIRGSAGNDRRTWLEQASPENVLDDLTQCVIQGEENCFPIVEAKELAAFEAKFGSTSSAEACSADTVISALAQRWPGSVQALQNARPSLEAVLQMHSAYPFASRHEPITSPALLRAVVLMTNRSDKVLGLSHSVFNGKQDKVVKRPRTEADKLRLLFWALARSSGPARDNDIEPSTRKAEQSDISDVLGVIQRLHRPPGGSKITPLSREDLKPLAQQLSQDLPMINIPNHMSGENLAHLTAFVKALGSLGGDDLTARESEENPLSFDDFVAYARQIKLLETLDQAFGILFE